MAVADPVCNSAPSPERSNLGPVSQNCDQFCKLVALSEQAAKLRHSSAQSSATVLPPLDVQSTPLEKSADGEYPK